MKLTIENFKETLLNKARKKGLCENFGEKETQQLKDNYHIQYLTLLTVPSGNQSILWRIGYQIWIYTKLTKNKFAYIKYLY